MNDLPKVQLSQEWFRFIPLLWGEKLTKTVVVENLTPNIPLEGEWEIAGFEPQLSDRELSWVSITPAEFNGNYAECVIKVDTKI